MRGLAMNGLIHSIHLPTSMPPNLHVLPAMRIYHGLMVYPNAFAPLAPQQSKAPSLEPTNTLPMR